MTLSATNVDHGQRLQRSQSALQHVICVKGRAQGYSKTANQGRIAVTLCLAAILPCAVLDRIIDACMQSKSSVKGPPPC